MLVLLGSLLVGYTRLKHWTVVRAWQNGDLLIHMLRTDVSWRAQIKAIAGI